MFIIFLSLTIYLTFAKLTKWMERINGRIVLWGVRTKNIKNYQSLYPNTWWFYAHFVYERKIGQEIFISDRVRLMDRKIYGLMSWCANGLMSNKI